MAHRLTKLPYAPFVHEAAWAVEPQNTQVQECAIPGVNSAKPTTTACKADRGIVSF